MTIVLSLGQNMRPFAGHCDVFISVENSHVGQKPPNKQTNERMNERTNKQTNKQTYAESNILDLYVYQLTKIQPFSWCVLNFLIALLIFFF